VFRPWIESLAAGVAELMANPSEYGHARTVVPKDGSAPFFQDYCNWSRIPDFERFVLHSPAAEIAAALMQSKTATFFHEHTLVKPPGGSTVTPWHHDQPYYCVEGSKTSASGSRWTRWRKRSRCAASAVPTAGATSSAQPVLTAQSFTHTAVLKSCRILMRIRMITILLAGRWSREMPSPFITGRCTARGQCDRACAAGFSARWVGDDATFADRGGVTSPPFPELTLKDGEALVSPLFPGLAARVMLNYHRAVSSRPEFARPPFSPVSPIAHIISCNAFSGGKLPSGRSCWPAAILFWEGGPVLSTSQLILKVVLIFGPGAGKYSSPYSSIF
jgi:hypothetical protein